jgi:hypothetical protein
MIQETELIKQANSCIEAYSNCGNIMIPTWFLPHANLTTAMFCMDRISMEQVARIEARLEVMMEDQQQILTLLKRS